MVSMLPFFHSCDDLVFLSTGCSADTGLQGDAHPPQHLVREFWDGRGRWRGQRNGQRAPGGQREGSDLGREEEHDPDRGPDLHRAEAAAGEQEQQVSSEDREACIVNQLRVYHKSK